VFWLAAEPVSRRVHWLLSHRPIHLVLALMGTDAGHSGSGREVAEAALDNTAVRWQKVKDLFGDWEDKWWPKPLATGQRAAVPAFRPHLAAAE